MGKPTEFAMPTGLVQLAFEERWELRLLEDVLRILLVVVMLPPALTGGGRTHVANVWAWVGVSRRRNMQQSEVS